MWQRIKRRTGSQASAVSPSPLLPSFVGQEREEHANARRCQQTRTNISALRPVKHDGRLIGPQKLGLYAPSLRGPDETGGQRGGRTRHLRHAMGCAGSAAAKYEPKCSEAASGGRESDGSKSNHLGTASFGESMVPFTDRGPIWPWVIVITYASILGRMNTRVPPILMFTKGAGF